ncbi:MAG: hypothetical protein WCF16_07265 [Alphaproteobacteria bacterium]
MPALAQRAATGAVRVPPTALVTILALVALGLAATLATVWQDHGVDKEMNVLFDADPGTGLPCFAHFRHWYGIRHPAVCALVSSTIRVAAEAAAAAGLVADQEGFRETVASYVTPAASALGVAAAGALAWASGIGVSGIIVLCALLGLSFSQLVFGSIPEHFAITGLLLGLTLLLGARPPPARRSDWLIWIAAGTAATAVTVTNLVFFFLILFFSLGRSGNAWGALRRAVPIGLLCLVIALSVGKIGDFVYGYWHTRDIDSLATHVTKFLRPDPARNVLAFPRALGDAFAPAALRVKVNVTGIEHHQAHETQFSLEDGEEIWRAPLRVAGVIAAAMVLGAGLGLRRSFPQRHLILASLCILVFSGVLHAFWGDGYFLYSQHWLMASLVLLFPLFVEPRTARPAAIVFAVIVPLVAYSNFEALRAMALRL